MENNDLNNIRKLLPQAVKGLIEKPNVVAVGIGYKTVGGQKTDRLGIICSVETKIPADRLGPGEMIPSRINGTPTDVIPTGIINTLDLPTGRFRPVPGGVSGGHFRITTGTLGCRVKKGDIFMILSNNHVIANSNHASPGDPVLQPGPHDGGRVSTDQIAVLDSFVPIKFETQKSSSVIARSLASLFNFFARLTGSPNRLYSKKTVTAENLVDCALAEPAEPGLLLNEIHGIGKIAGIQEGTLGMEIKKSGRTTGLTTGMIDQTDVTVRVHFGSGKTALFTDQLMAGAMSQGGDSGSVVLDGENNIVGLLFAGSTTTTVINRIQNVVNLLGIEVL